MSIGENIKKFRKIRGLTQKELATFAKCSESSIRKYEANNRTPSSDTLMDIADVLGISILVLLDNNNNSNNLTDEDNKNIYKLLSDSEFCNSILDYMGYFILSCDGEEEGDPKYTISDSENNRYVISQNEFEELIFDLISINKFEIAHFFEKIKRR